MKIYTKINKSVNRQLLHEIVSFVNYLLKLTKLQLPLKLHNVNQFISFIKFFCQSTWRFINTPLEILHLYAKCPLNLKICIFFLILDSKDIKDKQLRINFNILYSTILQVIMMKNSQAITPRNDSQVAIFSLVFVSFLNNAIISESTSLSDLSHLHRLQIFVAKHHKHLYTYAPTNLTKHHLTMIYDEYSCSRWLGSWYIIFLAKELRNIAEKWGL